MPHATLGSLLPITIVRGETMARRICLILLVIFAAMTVLKSPLMAEDTGHYDTDDTDFC